jgi:hypothetical protein
MLALWRQPDKRRGGDDVETLISQSTSDKMASQLMPLELIDRCIGSRMRVIMKGDKGEHFIASE